jgi:hypothetical protein
MTDIVYRFLDPHNFLDSARLDSILDQYVDEERAKTIKGIPTVYPLESVEFTANYIATVFARSRTYPPNTFIINGGFRGDELIYISVAKKLNHQWGYDHTVIPSWIYFFLYSRDREINFPIKRMKDLLVPLVTVMQKEKFYSWYKVTKLSRTVNTDNLDDYLKRVYSKMVPMGPYNNMITVEAIIDNQDAKDNLPTAYRNMFPIKVHNGVRLALMMHHYSNNIRIF